MWKKKHSINGIALPKTNIVPSKMGWFGGGPFFWPQYFTNLDFTRKGLPFPETRTLPKLKAQVVWARYNLTIRPEWGLIHLHRTEHASPWWLQPCCQVVLKKKLTNVWLVNSEFTKKIEIQKKPENSVINKKFNHQLFPDILGGFLQSSLHPPQLFFFGRLVIGQNLLNQQNHQLTYKCISWFDLSGPAKKKAVQFTFVRKIDLFFSPWKMRHLVKKKQKNNSLWKWAQFSRFDWIFVFPGCFFLPKTCLLLPRSRLHHGRVEQQWLLVAPSYSQWPEWLAKLGPLP